MWEIENGPKVTEIHYVQGSCASSARYVVCAHLTITHRMCLSNTRFQITSALQWRLLIRVWSVSVRICVQSATKVLVRSDTDFNEVRVWGSVGVPVHPKNFLTILHFQCSAGRFAKSYKALCGTLKFLHTIGSHTVSHWNSTLASLRSSEGKTVMLQNTETSVL